MGAIKLHKNTNHEKILGYGFRRFKGKTNYSYTATLYSYKSIPVIEAQFVISPIDNNLWFDVIDCNSDSLYATFYNRTHSNPENNEVLKTVLKRLNIELNKMRKANIIQKYEEVV